MKTKQILMASILAAATGCTDNSTPSLRDINDSNIKKLRGAYGLFIVRHNMRGPESEEELKEFIRSDGGAVAKMKEMGVAPGDVEGLFVSERDGKPFRIRYGLGGLGNRALIFESEGVDGQRMVALTTPRDVGPAEYDELWEQEGPVDAGPNQVFAD